MKKLILLLALIAFFASGLTLSTKAQTNADYLGTWAGTTKTGTNYELVLSSDWHCVLKVNSTVMTDVVAYRVYANPGEDARMSDVPFNGRIKHAIKFFTQNALNGVFCAQNGMGTVGPPVENSYPGFVKIDKTQDDMILENIDFLISPCSITSGNVITPITLIKQ